LGCWGPTRVPGLPAHRPPPPTRAPPGGPWEMAADTATDPGDNTLGAPMPGTTARQRAAHRGRPGAVGTRHGRLPRPRRPAPDDRPHARPDTPTRPRHRTWRPPTTPHPCSRCRGHDASLRRGRWRQHGHAHDISPAAARAGGDHDDPARGSTPHPPAHTGPPGGTGNGTTAAWSLACRWAWDGLGERR